MIEFIGFIFILILGTLGHYIYQLTGKNKLSAIFFAVNESTWEHMKLVIGPAFLWMFIEMFFIGDNPNFIFAKFVSVAIMMIFIPLFFYGYRKLLNTNNNAVLNIVDFILAIALGQIASYFILNIEAVPSIVNMISIIGLIIIFISYILLTKFPLQNFLFLDPKTNKYGIFDM